jgi:uncharacterized protein with gpF-like domain
VPPEYTFPGPVPQEALDYFEAKGLQVGFNWYEVWAEEHNCAFTAAKILELDILATMRGLVERAIEEGKTFETWRKEVKPLLDKSGWSNYGTEKTEKHRMRIIYDTNMRTSRAAGQWQRIERTKTVLPFLTYELGPSVKHRDEHVSWAGTTLPVDDPWWDSHFPPLGYGCKCNIIQEGLHEVEQRGGPSDRPQSYDVEWTLPDGRRVTAPVGVHPTFNFNAGKSRTTGLEQALIAAESR